MSNTPIRYVDVAIIGAGTAGQTAFSQVNQATDNIVIINDGYWTTTCATVGCMPSKLLIAAAERAHHACNSAKFGIYAQDVTTAINGQQVMQRVQAERDRFTGFIQDKIDGWETAKKISGRASFTEQGLITVNNELIKANYIIIATGTQPFVPDDWAESLGDTLLTSDTVFELKNIPKSMAVIGAGAIGLELAQAFNRLGCMVTLFNKSARIGGLSDQKVTDKAIACLSNELNMVLDADIMQVKEQQGQAIIYYKTDGSEQTWQGDYVLVATGRRHNLLSMQAQNIGIHFDERNQPQDVNASTGQVKDSHVYIVGDANGHLPLLHVASNEGLQAGLHVKQRLTVDNQQNDSHLKSTIQSETTTQTESNNHQDYRQSICYPKTPISVVFCEPQIASVGKSLQQLDKTGANYVIGEVSFDDQGRSRVMGVNCGLLRIYACQHSSKILGASMIAPDAEYIAHILATAITNNLTVMDLLASPFYHPTILEGLRTALRDIQQQMDNKLQQVSANERYNKHG
ncbi:dihydrolipoyl dehydrogenase [Psychrobacter sp. I-STPA10]|uniref:dihydrolipoyl dehydrogenase n=1 Tax=Psychrobacter sp. I-STPA10 TaxID=2585769 RepID=UPI001E3FD56D|nr:dihydrolipoyl dehydrogenase [Psychrobacter sp. I-STPA10]